MLEWKRLGIPQISVPGFCMVRLTQRLLDPLPATNCKLQTLRQYYRLPANGAHMAMGDVLTVVDPMQQVLQDPDQRKTYELLTRAINEARDRGDIGLLQLIAKDPLAFILKQGWASVSLDGERGLKELRPQCKTYSLVVRARHAARARHGTREGACAPLDCRPVCIVPIRGL